MSYPLYVLVCRAWTGEAWDQTHMLSHTSYYEHRCGMLQAYNNVCCASPFIPDSFIFDTFNYSFYSCPH